MGFNTHRCEQPADAHGFSTKISSHRFPILVCLFVPNLIEFVSMDGKFEEIMVIAIRRVRVSKLLDQIYQCYTSNDSVD